MMVTADVRLQFGDVLIIVGDARALEHVAAELGNSPKQLDETNFIPVFFGIVLGIIAGSLPIALPGLPVPVRLGLAEARWSSPSCLHVSAISDGSFGTCRATSTTRCANSALSSSSRASG
jgi:hypothetical protein